ncbi:MAG: DeoR/GlpR family DNA-binding transcription regulator [Candidatus Dormibacteraeota bacterium]|nr:DeoR/GlpR family DNA-binding transcription regulator [Candidatus Dormibacteraeota bacterium]
MSEQLPAEVRRRQILGRIQRNGGASINELARDFAISPVTAHRDLEALAREGVLTRIHGGARSIEGESHQVETDFMKRLRQNQAAKQLIAARALREVPDGATIFIDHSTSSLALAQRLERRPPKTLTVVTNSPAIANELQQGAIHLIVTPGEVDQVMRMISGGWTEEFLSRLNFDVAFVSAAGLTLERGLTTTRQSLAGTLSATRAVSQRLVALIDHSKMGRDSLLTIFGAQEPDQVIVDEGAPPDLVASYREAGVNLVIAEAAVRRGA